MISKDIKPCIQERGFECSDNVSENRIDRKINIVSCKSDHNEVVIFKDKTSFDRVLKGIKERKNLVIISDFDYTISKKYHSNSKDSLKGTNNSCFCFFDKSDLISDHYKEKSKEMFLTLAKFESDLSSDFALRMEKIKKWYIDSLELLVDEKIKEVDFITMLEKSEGHFFLRHGIVELLELLNELNISMSVISGGIHQIIDTALEYVSSIYTKLKERELFRIHSNKLSFDNHTKMISGYLEPTVFTFNKAKIVSDAISQEFDGTEDIIVLGDHLNDLDCLDNLTYNSAIKIGFFNYNPEDEAKKPMLQEYKNKFDVIITNDGSLSYVVSLIKDIYS